MISAHEQGGNRGYLRVGSPDGNNFVEFKNLSQVAMAGPSRGKLWVNEKRVLGAEYGDLCQGFGPSCAWSPDSRFITLIMWAKGNDTDTVYAIYDTQSDELLVVNKRKYDYSDSYTIKTARKVFRIARKNGFVKTNPLSEMKEKVQAEINNYETLEPRWADIPPYYNRDITREISNEGNSKPENEARPLNITPASRSTALDELENIKTTLLSQSEHQKKATLEKPEKDKTQLLRVFIIISMIGIIGRLLQLIVSR